MRRIKSPKGRGIISLSEIRRAVQAVSVMTPMERLRLDIAGKLCEIEDLCKARNLEMPRVTLIARDPDRPGMIVVVTNEPGDELAQAFDAAMNLTPPPDK